MAKPVTPGDLFDLWQKMVNPGAFPMQSLMFPVTDLKEVEKKIAELETVEHWLKANLNLLQLSIRSLEYQRTLLKGGERAREAIAQARAPDAGPGDAPANPAQWIWDLMAEAQKSALAPSTPPRKKRGR